MRKKPAILCIAAALPAALAFAQGPGTPPDPQTMIQMRVNMLATRLGLTDAQKATATSIFTTAYTAGESIRSSLRTNRQSLSDAVKKNDAAAIDQLSGAIGTSTGQLTAINGKADAAFYAILTADQKTKYDAMPRGRGGFGGPMGPGGGMGPMSRRIPL